MRIPVLCLLLLLAFPAHGQVFATPEQEIAELNLKITDLQTAFDALTVRVTELETAPAPAASLPIPTAALIDFAPGMANSAIACTVVADTPTVCNVRDLSGAYEVNGDPLTVEVICDAGTHNGMEYTGPGGSCTFQLSDGTNINPEGQLTVIVATP
ncbi:MAG: hypothetical protein ACR2QC_07880 [Gammaproteobacteria bacterium]